MSTLSVTAKGQVTLRKDLLKHLGVKPGDKIDVNMLPDGRIVGADGGSNVFVEAKGNLYGVLQHRNHLAVMSATPVFTNRIVTFDSGHPFS